MEKGFFLVLLNSSIVKKVSGELNNSFSENFILLCYNRSGENCCIHIRINHDDANRSAIMN